MRLWSALGQQSPKRRNKANGDQLVISGAERFSMKEQLARLADQPISPRRGQVALRGTALFGGQRR